MTEKQFTLDFIGFGAPRSGTTWIYQCLDEHPEICVSRPKEIEFFNTTQMFWRKDLDGSSNYTKGMDWYKKHFEHCNKAKVRGEISPIYLYDPDAAQRIFTHFPHARLFAILRNPVERLYSHYMYTKSKGFYTLPETFEETVQREKDFVGQGLYYKHLQNYLSYFRKDQMLIMIYEDIAEDPMAFLQEIYGFLGVEKVFIPSSVKKTVNTAASKVLAKKLSYIAGVLKETAIGRGAFRVLQKTKMFAIVRDSIFTSGTVRLPYGRIHPSTKRHLNEVYGEDLTKLEEFLGRDLSLWKE